VSKRTLDALVAVRKHLDHMKIGNQITIVRDENTVPVLPFEINSAD
jgi:hypothetical protein